MPEKADDGWGGKTGSTHESNLSYGSNLGFGGTVVCRYDHRLWPVWQALSRCKIMHLQGTSLPSGGCEEWAKLAPIEPYTLLETGCSDGLQRCHVEAAVFGVLDQHALHSHLFAFLARRVEYPNAQQLILLIAQWSAGHGF